MKRVYADVFMKARYYEEPMRNLRYFNFATLFVYFTKFITAQYVAFAACKFIMNMLTNRCIYAVGEAANTRGTTVKISSSRRERKGFNCSGAGQEFSRGKSSIQNHCKYSCYTTYYID